MAFSNRDKSKHGRDAQYSLDTILKRSKDENYVAEFVTPYRAGREGFSNDKQFYAPFIVYFDDGSQWALFTTTSMRTDRIKGQQWDAANLKSINPQITKVFLVYPDSVSEKDRSEFIRQNEKYRNQEEFSAIDAIVSQDEISNLIEMQSIKGKSSGQIKDRQGNSFEKRVADLLSYQRNLEKWISNDRTIEGMHYDTYKLILDCFQLESSMVYSIHATSDKNSIGRLPSGGSPKTDVLVSVATYDNHVIRYTISCKRSSSSSVSVHQYTADKFADVLDAEDTNLRSLLGKFQEAGNLRDFGESNCIALESALSPHIRNLTLWVLGGHGGEGDPETQNANFILTYDNNDNTSSIHTVEEYADMLMQSNTSGHFGTPFSWTYPSGRKGKDIQLKCKIIK